MALNGSMTLTAAFSPATWICDKLTKKRCNIAPKRSETEGLLASDTCWVESSYNAITTYPRLRGSRLLYKIVTIHNRIYGGSLFSTLHGSSAVVIITLAWRPTCLKYSLFEEFAVCVLVFDSAFIVLRAWAGRILRRRRTEGGRHLLAAESFPLALLRHLQPELVVRSVVACSHIPVSDDSV